MASSSKRVRVRYSIDVNFDSEERKQTFKLRMESIRKRLTPSGSPSLDNFGLMYAMFDIVEGVIPADLAGTARETCHTQSFQRNSGNFLCVL